MEPELIQPAWGGAVIAFLAIVLAFFLFGIFGLWYTISRYKKYRKVRLEDAFAKENLLPVDFEVIDFLQGPANIPEYPNQVKESGDFHAQLDRIGERMKKSGVTQLVFVHGTFAGEDPLGVGELLGRREIKLARWAGQKWNKLSKFNSDRFLKDNGNFLPQYVEVVQSGLGHGIRCTRFNWSSENHHLGRLRAACRLLQHLQGLSKETEKTGKQRYLLIGHSHAGAVFALASLLLYDPKGSAVLLKTALEFLPEDTDLEEVIRHLSRSKVDLVTLGMPPRYPFAQSPRLKLLHFINSREEVPVGSEGFKNRLSTSGILTTRYGDYIQRIGGHGSDFVAASSTEREANRVLDGVLQKGVDPATWLQGGTGVRQLSPYGKNLLVDYGDHGGKRVNCVGTLFGHGIYTRYSSLFFQLKTISRYLYD